MPVTARRERILELIRGTGYLAIEELAARFEVTPQTIRADLNLLADAGRLVRHHGGASIPSSVRNTDYAQRHGEFAREKTRIGQRLAAWLPDHSSVFLSLGTTTLAVAHALRARSELKVITNNLEAAQVLVAQPGVEVIVLGGRVERRNLGVSGTSTLAAVEQYRADYCLFSVGAVDQDGSLLDYHEAEVAVVRAMMQRARRRVLVIDHSKFGRTASVRIGSLTEVSAIVTDQPLPPGMRALLRGHPVECIAADARPRTLAPRRAAR
ncbi:MAG: DeoR/GlpR family DNA-binding transcription regulator [Burkholderiaceae bacterium]